MSPERSVVFVIRKAVQCIIAIGILVIPAYGVAQAGAGIPLGLLVDSPNTLTLHVYIPLLGYPDDRLAASRLELRQLIENEVSAGLVRVGITPETNFPFLGADLYLYVEVDVGEGAGRDPDVYASFRIALVRDVYIVANGQTHRTPGSTYQLTRHHIPMPLAGRPDDLLDQLDSYLEAFLESYLDVNRN